MLYTGSGEPTFQEDMTSEQLVDHLEDVFPNYDFSAIDSKFIVLTTFIPYLNICNYSFTM